MSFTEMLTEVEKITAAERRELMKTLREAKRQNRIAALNQGEKPKSFLKPPRISSVQSTAESVICPQTKNI